MFAIFFLFCNKSKPGKYLRCWKYLFPSSMPISSPGLLSKERTP